MATKNYEVLVDELTVHRKVGDLTDPITGRVIGIQQGQGKVYFKGEVIPGNAVSPLLIEALEDEDHPSHESASKKIKEVSSDPTQDIAVRAGLPFDGYDDMDEEEILGAMSVLPSSTIQAIKKYEAEQGDGRERIVNYNIGFAQSPTDRQEGRAGSDLDEDGRDESEKAVAKLKTREVPEEGLVEPGEGITGTGDPEIPHGAAAAEDDDKPKSARRRSRRPRQQSGGQSGGSESGSGGE